MSYYLTEILKIGKYQQRTSVSVPYLYTKVIYCVEFVNSIKWFETLEEAQAYTAYLYENYFFLLEDILEKPHLQIKEYNVR